VEIGSEMHLIKWISESISKREFMKRSDSRMKRRRFDFLILRVLETFFIMSMMSYIERKTEKMFWIMKKGQMIWEYSCDV
jgi:hypothetical protein